MVQGDLTGAEQAVREMESVNRSAEIPLFRPWIESLRVQLWLAQGHLKQAADWAERTIHLQPRVLFATGTFPDPENWNRDFAALSVELVDFLHERGVITVGIDTPSVDLFESKDLPAHKAILRCNMSILEGLVLKNVPEGTYELIALPLRLVGFDASPVRAVLRTV